MAQDKTVFRPPPETTKLSSCCRHGLPSLMYGGRSQTNRSTCAYDITPNNMAVMVYFPNCSMKGQVWVCPQGLHERCT
eukprot:5975905-Amphidinium_carterae.1